MNKINNIFNLRKFSDWDNLFRSNKIFINKNFCFINNISNEKLNNILKLISKGLFKFYFKCWSILPEDYSKIFTNEEPLERPRIGFVGDISYFAAIRDFVYQKRNITFMYDEELKSKKTISIDELPYDIKCKLFDYPLDSVWFNIDSQEDLNSIIDI